MRIPLEGSRIIGKSYDTRKAPSALQYPALEEFSGIVSEAGLTQWTLEETGAETEGSSEQSFSKARLYELYNQGRRIRCQFFTYLYHAKTPG